MDCERHNQNLSAFLDGTLSRSEAKRVESHVRRCRGCNEELAELTRLKQILAALPDAEPAPDFWADSFRRVRSARPTRGAVARMRIRQGLTVCAAAASIFLVALLAQNESPTGALHPYEPTTIHADSLVALHTSLRTEMPLADTGTLRFAHIDGITSDWANDHQLDFE